MLKAALFDLDGTLLDTVAAIRHNCNLALARFGLPGIGDEQVKVFAGDGAAKLVERSLAFAGGAPDLLDAALAAYLEYFRDGCMYQVKPYDGIPELLRELKARGLKLAVVTNKPQAMAERNIRDIFGDGVFDYICAARDGLPRKPDPAPALEAARVLGATPAECLYIGDTNTDMQTGTAAAMVVCGALWGFRTRDELAAFRPRLLAAHPLDILAAL